MGSVVIVVRRDILVLKVVGVVVCVFVDWLLRVLSVIFRVDSVIVD